MKKVRTIFSLMIIVLIFSSCQREKTKVTIFASAGLTDALLEIEEIYEKENKNIDIVFNFDGSGILKNNILDGTYCDVFFPAGLHEMDEIEQNGLLINETRRDVLHNKVVMIAKMDSTLQGFFDLASSKVTTILLGDPDIVSVGYHTEDLLTHYNLKDLISSKIEYRSSVKDIIKDVEQGIADAGFVYMTDAYASNFIKIVDYAPNDSVSELNYPVAVIRTSEHLEESTDIIDYFLGPKSLEIFEKYGFIVSYY